MPGWVKIFRSNMTDQINYSFQVIQVKYFRSNIYGQTSPANAGLGQTFPVKHDRSNQSFISALFKSNNLGQTSPVWINNSFQVIQVKFNGQINHLYQVIQVKFTGQINHLYQVVQVKHFLSDKSLISGHLKSNISGQTSLVR